MAPKIEWKYPDDEKRFKGYTANSKAFGTVGLAFLLFTLGLGALFSFYNVAVILAGVNALVLIFFSSVEGGKAREMLIVCDCHVTPMEKQP